MRSKRRPGARNTEMKHNRPFAFYSCAIFLSISTLLTGCATTFNSTGVQSRLGVQQIDSGIYRLSVREGHFTSYTAVERAVLSKVAELALQDGYQRFVLLPDDEKVRGAEASNTLRQYAQSGNWGGLEGFSTVKVSRQHQYIGGIHTNAKGTKGSTVAVMFKQNEKRVAKGIDVKTTLARLNAIKDERARRTGY